MQNSGMRTSPGKVRVSPAATRAYQEPIREAMPSQLQGAEAYDAEDMEIGEDVVIGSPYEEGQYVDPSEGEVYYDDETMMYDAGGCDES